jgi:acetyl-CoA carboxylase carboxyl transferase subunit alpha
MIEMASCLEFEKPICELEQKLIQLEEFGQSQGVDVEQGAAELRKRIDLARQELAESLSPWQRVQLARHSDRPYPRDYIQRICTDFMEFHGDRRFADDEAIVGGFAKFDGESVMVIGTQKGRDLKENVRYNFGSARPEGYRKALRLMKMADLARVPILLLIDTPGAYPGVGAEERHIGEAIAVNLREMFKLNVPVVAVVVGEGGSGGALGIGVGNRVLIMKNAYYSVITPEGCAAILWHDGAKTPQAAAALKLTSADLLRMSLVDEVIEEPLGGAHRDYDQAAELLAEAVRRNLQDLKGMPKEELWQQRYEKFRKMGVFQEV